jgi:F-type H+-transporting ATPase subunit delta
MGFMKAVGRRAFSEAAAPATVMTLNFVTPHSSVYTKKEVDKVTLPGEMGEYGITVNHSPIISQLRPGVVQVIHLGVSRRNFIVFSARCASRPIRCTISLHSTYVLFTHF